MRNYFQEFENHLLNDSKPSDYFNDLVQTNRYPHKYPYNMIYSLKEIEQNPKYHPEGNVWNHTMQVIDNGTKYSNLSSNKKVLMWSALLHDIGKGTTTHVRKGRIVSYNHEKEGENLTKKFLREFKMDEIFVKNVSKLVRWHMEPFFITRNLPYSKGKYMAQEVSIGDIAVLSLCDRLGRGYITREKEVEEVTNLLYFIEKCYEKKYIDINDNQIIEILDYLSKKTNSFIEIKK